MNWCEVNQLLDRSSSGMHHDGHAPYYRACRRCEWGSLFRGFNFRGSASQLRKLQKLAPSKISSHTA